MNIFFHTFCGYFPFCCWLLIVIFVRLFSLFFLPLVREHTTKFMVFHAKTNQPSEQASEHTHRCICSCFHRYKCICRCLERVARNVSMYVHCESNISFAFSDNEPFVNISRVVTPYFILYLDADFYSLYLILSHFLYIL